MDAKPTVEPALETWYVRLPDGRVLRAASGNVVRQHLAAGRIPPDSRVRQKPDQEWVALEWVEEFSDLLRIGKAGNNGGLHEGKPVSPFAPVPSGIAERYDPTRLQTIGLRGLAGELIAALDNTLSRLKLLVGGTGGVLSALVVAGFLALYWYGPSWFPAQWPWSLARWIGAGLLLILVAAVGAVLLTQMTYAELSYLRPATWRDARHHLLRFSFRLVIAYLIAGGCTCLFIWLLRSLPDWLVSYEGNADLKHYAQVAARVLGFVGPLLEVVLWPILVFTLLLGPVVVIEEGSVLTALSQWWWLVRRHLGRLFLYEAIALIGGIATLTFAFPLLLAAWGRLHVEWNEHSWFGILVMTGPEWNEYSWFSILVLTGLAAAPLLTYLSVAHVFIYLNIRYEYEPRKANNQ